MGFLQVSTRKAAIAREDWVLLVIGASDGLLPVQLQKSLYLLGHRFPELVRNGFYEFHPVGGGDFSEAIYADAETLARKGLVTIRQGDDGRHYRLTPAGVQRAKKLEKQVTPALNQSMRNVVNWVKARSMDQLLRGAIEPADAIKASPRSRAWVPPS